MAAQSETAANSAIAGPLTATADFKARLIEDSQDCIKVLDLEGRLLSMNAGGMKLLEICDLGPIIGSSWIDFWNGEDREAARNAVQTARQGGVGRFVGFFATTRTKTPKWFDVSVSPILDEQGEPEMLVAASRDVTVYKRAELGAPNFSRRNCGSYGRRIFPLPGQARGTGVGRQVCLRCRDFE